MKRIEARAIEAEQAAIGISLNFPNLLCKIDNFICSSAFFWTCHQEIFRQLEKDRWRENPIPDAELSEYAKALKSTYKDPRLMSQCAGIINEMSYIRIITERRAKKSELRDRDKLRAQRLSVEWGDTTPPDQTQA